jgi:phage shock protein C
MERKLYRSRKNRLFLGVCGGLGEYFKMDPAVIRVIAVLITIASAFSAIVAYFILALIVPVEGSSATTPRDAFHENISDFTRATNNIKDGFKTPHNGDTGKNEITDDKQAVNINPTVPRRSSGQSLFIIAVILIVVGIFFFIINRFGWLWHYVWPMTLIASGCIVIAIVFGRLSRPK